MLINVIPINLFILLSEDQLKEFRTPFKGKGPEFEQSLSASQFGGSTHKANNRFRSLNTFNLSIGTAEYLNN